MRPLGMAIVLVLVAGAPGCGNKKRPKPQVTMVPIPLPIAPPARLDAGLGGKLAGAHPAVVRKRLQLLLRSTPEGAAASVDGRVVGATPTRWQMEDDGRPHNFTFLLKGYAPWRLRFSPVHDGAIHATLRPVEAPDAGPR